MRVQSQVGGILRSNTHIPCARPVLSHADEFERFDSVREHRCLGPATRRFPVKLCARASHSSHHVATNKKSPGLEELACFFLIPTKPNQTVCSVASVLGRNPSINTRAGILRPSSSATFVHHLATRAAAGERGLGTWIIHLQV